MAVRVHRRVGLVIPGAPLLARSLVAADDFRSAAIRTAYAINPVLDVYLDADIETNAFAASIGLGAQVPSDLDLYLDWHGGLGVLATAPVPAPALDPQSMFGAATAAVLGAAALFRLVHDQPVRPARFNPIKLAAGVDAGTRPAVLGACLTMTAADAGWPHGEPTTTPVDKAFSAARAIGGGPHIQWYDQWQPDHEARHDLVLPLANNRDVRTLITQRGEPLLLHATTSSNWTAELHRHRPDRDDCPSCRIPDTSASQFTCATGPSVPEQPDSPDAALPFLSAGTGLMLAAALADLPHSAALTTQINHWQLDLTLPGQLLRSWRHSPREGCQHVQPRYVRGAFHASNPCRWDDLDQ
jgi:hypothetical protein